MDRIYDNITNPNAPGTTIPDLMETPLQDVPQEDLASPLHHNAHIANHVPRFGKIGWIGSKLMAVRPQNYTQGPTGNKTLITWINRLLDIEHQHFKVFLSTVPDHIRYNDLFLRIFAKRASVSDSTHLSYLRKVKQVIRFARQKKLTKYTDIQIYEFLKFSKIDRILKFFLLDKAQKRGIAISYINTFKCAICYTLRLFLLKNSLDNQDFSELHAAIGRIYGRKPKRTKAIPAIILRYLLEFLLSIDPHSAKLFFLLFIFGTRASEALKIQKSHVSKFHDFTGKGYNIWIKNPKTQKATPDDGRTLTFYASPQNHIFDPYTLITYFYHSSNNSIFLFPFPGNHQKRLRWLYTWFNTIKETFPQWLWAHKHINISCAAWRLHGLRTTLIGLMRKNKASWAIVKKHVGHTYDSNVAEKLYFLNCLNTPGFDDSFDKILKSTIQFEFLKFPKTPTPSPSPDWETSSSEDEEPNNFSRSRSREPTSPPSQKRPFTLRTPSEQTRNTLSCSPPPLFFFHQKTFTIGSISHIHIKHMSILTKRGGLLPLISKKVFLEKGLLHCFRPYGPNEAPIHTLRAPGSSAAAVGLRPITNSNSFSMRLPHDAPYSLRQRMKDTFDIAAMTNAYLDNSLCIQPNSPREALTGVSTHTNPFTITCLEIQQVSKSFFSFFQIFFFCEKLG